MHIQAWAAHSRQARGSRKACSAHVANILGFLTVAARQRPAAGDYARQIVEDWVRETATCRGQSVACCSSNFGGSKVAPTNARAVQTEVLLMPGDAGLFLPSALLQSSTGPYQRLAVPVAACNLTVCKDVTGLTPNVARADAILSKSSSGK